MKIGRRVPALLVRLEVELQLLPFPEIVKPGALQRTHMNEHVSASVDRLNEAESLRAVVELHRSSNHRIIHSNRAKDVRGNRHARFNHRKSGKSGGSEPLTPRKAKIGQKNDGKDVRRNCVLIKAGSIDADPGLPLSAAPRLGQCGCRQIRRRAGQMVTLAVAALPRFGHAQSDVHQQGGRK